MYWDAALDMARIARGDKGFSEEEKERLKEIFENKNNYIAP